MRTPRQPIWRSDRRPPRRGLDRSARPPPGAARSGRETCWRCGAIWAWARPYSPAPSCAARGDPFEDVPSPTFTLVQVYDAADGSEVPTYHFDLFRLESPEEAYELGIEEAFVGGVSLVEWPDRLGRLLPARRLDVELAEGSTPDARRVVLEGRGDWRAPRRLWRRTVWRRAALSDRRRRIDAFLGRQRLAARPMCARWRTTRPSAATTGSGPAGGAPC